MKLLHLAGAALALALSTDALAHGRLAEVSVVDRNDRRPLPVYWHEGKAYVVGRPGNEYQLSVRSRGEEVLAVVSVDGVNVVTGETAAAQQSGYVLSPGASLDIRGWRKSLERIASFYFTELPDSYAARTGRPENVGVIGVAVFRKKASEPIARPYAQPSAPFLRRGAGAAESAASDELASRSPAPEAKLGTGHGRDESSQARYVEFERASAQPAELITIYYDSRRNLIARRVIREPAPLAPLPRPFPGFVPDPLSLTPSHSSAASKLAAKWRFRTSS
ncbi:MAG: hypothetical protein HY017_29500 [Betaproteobacteria bacterium]|nr:hypothetical protein [Betaproteobacteria bacterium]